MNECRGLFTLFCGVRVGIDSSEARVTEIENVFVCVKGGWMKGCFPKIIENTPS